MEDESERVGATTVKIVGSSSPGQYVVVNISVVTLPTGQSVTESGQEVIV